jgi:hypothetical protein
MSRHVISEKEYGYRKGVHQALGLARRWLDRCDDLAEARARLEVAEEVARVVRYQYENTEIPQLLDEIDHRVTFGVRRNADGTYRTHTGLEEDE